MHRQFLFHLVSGGAADAVDVLEEELDTVSLPWLSYQIDSLDESTEKKFRHLQEVLEEIEKRVGESEVNRDRTFRHKILYFLKELWDRFTKTEPIAFGICTGMVYVDYIRDGRYGLRYNDNATDSDITLVEDVQFGSIQEATRYFWEHRKSLIHDGLIEKI